MQDHQAEFRVAFASLLLVAICITTASADPVQPEAQQRIEWPSMGFSLAAQQGWVRRLPNELEEGQAEFFLGFSNNREGVSAHLIVTISSRPNSNLKSETELRTEHYQFETAPQPTEVDGVPASRLVRGPKTPASSPHVAWVVLREGITYTIELFGAPDFPDTAAADRLAESIQWSDPQPASNHVRLLPSPTAVLDGEAAVPLPSIARRNSNANDIGDYYFVHDYVRGEEEAGFHILTGSRTDAKQTVEAFASDYFGKLVSSSTIEVGALNPQPMPGIENTWATRFVEVKPRKVADANDRAHTELRFIRYILRIFDDNRFVLLQVILNQNSIAQELRYTAISNLQAEHFKFVEQR